MSLTEAATSSVRSIRQQESPERGARDPPRLRCRQGVPAASKRTAKRAASVPSATACCWSEEAHGPAERRHAQTPRKLHNWRADGWRTILLVRMSAARIASDGIEVLVHEPFPEITPRRSASLQIFRSSSPWSFEEPGLCHRSQLVSQRWFTDDPRVATLLLLMLRRRTKIWSRCGFLSGNWINDDSDVVQVEAWSPRKLAVQSVQSEGTPIAGHVILRRLSGMKGLDEGCGDGPVKVHVCAAAPPDTRRRSLRAATSSAPYRASWRRTPSRKWRRRLIVALSRRLRSAAIGESCFVLCQSAWKRRIRAQPT